MAELPIIWRVNRKPRFTLSDMGEYMVADDGPRETIRRNMKYERIAPSILYSDLYRAVSKFLCSPTRNTRILHDFEDVLKNRLTTETNPQIINNISYVLRALGAFEQGLNELTVGGWWLEHPPRFSPLNIAGVRVAALPAAFVRISRPRGGHLIGAVLIDLAKGIEPKTDEAKVRASNAMTTAAILLHQHVTALGKEGEKASHEHCLVYHVFRRERIAAPTNYRKPLRNVEAVCRDIARAWADIEPPPTFDPSRARYRG